MTRSKALGRIENAITHRNLDELRWALAECVIRRKFAKGQSDRWDRREKRIRAALADTSK